MINHFCWLFKVVINSLWLVINQCSLLWSSYSRNVMWRLWTLQRIITNLPLGPTSKQCVESPSLDAKGSGSSFSDYQWLPTIHPKIGSNRHLFGKDHPPVFVFLGAITRCNSRPNPHRFGDAAIQRGQCCKATFPVWRKGLLLGGMRVDRLIP